MRLAGFGHPVSYFISPPGAPDRWIDNPAFGRRFFPPGLLRVPPPLSFRREKAPGTIRILVFGESAAMGDPRPACGVARQLEVLLSARYPASRFEVIPVAMTAINSHALLPMAKECTALGADFWLLFAGNNEMLGSFGAGSVLGRRAPPRFLVRLILASKATRTGQALETLAERLRGRAADSSRWTGLRVLAGESVTGDAPERQRTYATFEANLRDIVRAGTASGARVILGTVAVNLRDCSPFGSVHRTGISASDLAAWHRLVDEGRRALAAGDPARASDHFESAARIDAGHAGLQYLRGEAELARSNRVAAAGAFQLACDLDTIPLRTDSRLNDRIRRVARERAIPLVDTGAALAAGSPEGIPGGLFFYEHVHLTPEGNHALARAFGDVLADQLPAGIRGGGGNDWLPLEEADRRLAHSIWNRSASVELMIARCLDAPFTNRLGQEAHLGILAREAARLRRMVGASSVSQARGLYTNAIAAAPEDPHLRRNYAEFLAATGALPEASDQWRKVIDLLPHHPVAYLQSGSLLRRLGRRDEALPLLERAIALQPDWVEARLELAELRVAQGRPRDALEACRAALRLQPGHARAHLRLADALAADRQPTAAISSLEEAVRLDPRLWEARYLLGVEYALQDRLEAARAEFAEVVRLKPDHHRAHFNLGIAWARQQRWNEAAAALSEALRQDPRNEEARQALAQVNARRRQPGAP